MRSVLAGAEAAKGRCTDPEYLPLIDAAFARPGGKENHHIVDTLCPTCPINAACLTKALDGGEHGPWGGATERTRRKYVKRPATYNLQGINPNMRDGRSGPDAQPVQSPRAEDRRKGLLAALGVTSADVRRWAVDNGVPVADKGLPGAEVIEAYRVARELAVA